jgi:hypothetical protein
MQLTAICAACAQVTWVAMIICILFFEMNLATGAAPSTPARPIWVFSYATTACLQ